MYTSYYANKQLVLAKDSKAPQTEGEHDENVSLKAAVPRRTVDYMTPVVKMLQARNFIRDFKDTRGLQPTAAGALDILPPCCYPHIPATNFNTKFVHVSQNKVRCAINVVLWTPEGRRCMTGTASGEFTLWSGTTFNFESILQAHEFGVRAMRFSHNEHYLVSGDDSGRIKYWKPNLELLNDATAHREAVRGICFSPTDLKFCTCSDDATLKIWDFGTCNVDKVMSGHGADVKFVDWHPIKALIASCSKDAQVKLWSAKDGKCVSTLYGHKSGVSQAFWNRNGNWLLTAGRDQVCKIFDVRMMKEMASFRGHNKEVTCCEWHPFHEELFVSGASDGSLIYWLASRPEAQAKLMNAHDTAIWSLSWHPLGHLLATGSSDYVTKFWCRGRSGDVWRDRHLQDVEEGGGRESEAGGKIPGVGLGAEAPAMIPGIEDASKKGTRTPPALPFAGSNYHAHPPHGFNVPPPRPPPGPPPMHHPQGGRPEKRNLISGGWGGGKGNPRDWDYAKRPRADARPPPLDRSPFKRSRIDDKGRMVGGKGAHAQRLEGYDWDVEYGTGPGPFKDFPKDDDWGASDDYDDVVMVGSITRRFSAHGPVLGGMPEAGGRDFGGARGQRGRGFAGGRGPHGPWRGGQDRDGGRGGRWGNWGRGRGRARGFGPQGYDGGKGRWAG